MNAALGIRGAAGSSGVVVAISRGGHEATAIHAEILKCPYPAFDSATSTIALNIDLNLAGASRYYLNPRGLRHHVRPHPRETLP